MLLPLVCNTCLIFTATKLQKILRKRLDAIENYQVPGTGFVLPEIPGASVATYSFTLHEGVKCRVSYSCLYVDRCMWTYSVGPLQCRFTKPYVGLNCKSIITKTGKASSYIYWKAFPGITGTCATIQLELISVLFYDDKRESMCDKIQNTPS